MTNLTNNQGKDWFNYIAFDLWHEIGDPESERKLNLREFECDKWMRLE